VHHDFWWIFNKVPYATTDAYASGHWWDFLDKTRLCIGLPNTILFLIGTAFLLAQALPFKFWKNTRVAQELILVYGCLSALILGHTIFWTFGIANSFGMDRVLITIFPCIALITLRGLNVLLTQTERLSPNVSLAALAVVLPFILYFPFLSKKAGGWFWGLDSEQRLTLQMTDYIQKNIPDYANYRFYLEVPYLPMVLKQDRFDNDKCRRMSQMTEGNAYSRPSLIVWDSHYSFWDAHLKESDIDADPRYQKIVRFTSDENKDLNIALYRVDTAAATKKEALLNARCTPQAIRDMKTKMRNTPEWIAAVKEKAKTRNISLDSMMTLDAIYMLKQ
jgi:hypothetical protein